MPILAMIHISELKFEKPFSVSYLRNNRSSGQKSLRCFPQCTEKGHIASGFCGDHLEATATITKNPEFGDNWLERISVVGEIRPLSDHGISSGDKVSRRKLQLELRDTRATKSGGELLLGEMKILHENAHTAVVSITFNAEKHSWDYSWKSNRWSGVNNSHVVDVILVQSLTYFPFPDTSPPNSLDELDVYSSACGATFLILSSHKSPHLKRKLSAAAATAAGDDVGTNLSSTLGDEIGMKHIPKRRDMFCSIDPMSALLMALGDGNGLAGDCVTDSSFSYICDPQLPSVKSVKKISPSSGSNGCEGESFSQPAKRKRMKSMKMMEYTESIDEVEEKGVLEESEEVSVEDETIGKGKERIPLESLNRTKQDVSPSNICDVDTASGHRVATHVKDEYHYDDCHRYGEEDEYQEDRGDGEYEYESENDLDGSGIATRKKLRTSYKSGNDEDSINDSNHSYDGSHKDSSSSSSKEDLQNADSKIFDLRWNETFFELVTYCETFGHGNVPKDYKSAGGRWLGKWLDFQRQMKKKNRLRADRIARLEGLVNNGYLNMYDGPRRGHRLSGENVHRWEGWYNALLEYGEINGTYNVPRHYVIPASTSSTSSVTLFNTVGRKLGRWLQTQRLRGRSGDLRGDRLKRLQELADTGKLDWLGRESSACTTELKGTETEVSVCHEGDECDGLVQCSSGMTSSSSSSSTASSSRQSLMTSVNSADQFDICSSSMAEKKSFHVNLVHNRVEPHTVVKIEEEDKIGQPLPSTLWVHSADSAAAVVNGNRSGVGVSRATRNSERNPPLHHNGLEALLFAATSH